MSHPETPDHPIQNFLQESLVVTSDQISRDLPYVQYQDIHIMPMVWVTHKDEQVRIVQQKKANHQDLAGHHTVDMVEYPDLRQFVSFDHLCQFWSHARTEVSSVKLPSKAST